MDLNGWIEKYGTRDVVTLSEPRKCIEEYKQAVHNKQVFLYGGGAVGVAIVRILRQLDITINAVFDRNYNNREIPGVNVCSPEKMGAMLNEDCILIISVNWRNQEIIQPYIESMNLSIDYYDGSLIQPPLQRAICSVKNKNNEKIHYEECPNCFIERNYCDLLKENLLINKKDVVLHKGKSKLPLIGVILGNICTLNCNHCVESVPHTRINKAFEPKDKLIKAIKRMTDAIEFVTVVDFVGGEPFLYPDLAELIEEVLNIENVGMVNIFTNGTVKPPKRLLEALKKDEFLTVNVSDYSGQLSDEIKIKIKENVELLRTNHIAVTHVKDMTWYDMSSFEKNEDDEEQLEKRFHDCRLNSCHRLYDDKLFRCLHLYSGYVTGKLPLDETVLDIYEGSVDEFSKELDRFWEMPYSSACQYCELPYISKLVPSGEQKAK